ncbi:MAG: HAMP domain-containing histidine kinase [Nitrospirota bacterium]|nr:HAMP domain-containing histidine kinase [Nitrospirota bacterium]MDH5585294.1 HAMP domain-containing histidine kinase [Nitrospirota bacterium]MDH5774359.1 HAMP domain-containing histidine kinase [Nitrospirota bacterium]
MLPLDFQFSLQALPLSILMVGFHESDVPSACRVALASMIPQPSVDWVMTIQEGKVQAESGRQFDAGIVDCRADSHLWEATSCLVRNGQKTTFLGLTGASENTGNQSQIVEDVIGCRVNETSALTVLSWFLRQAQERKQCLVELQWLRSQLGEAAYKIELADVASTVLHNVGNVLTSVTVAANMVESLVDQSSVTLVNRMAELMHAHEQNLGAYLTEDPKGKRIPTSLGKLGSHLIEEQKTVVNEMKGLVRNIRHMKQIIVSQQTMAKSAGKVEPVVLVQVLSHAMEMSFQPEDEKWITIHCDYQDVLPVLADQHQLLQILVNLLRNAKQAMRQQCQEHHELCIKVNYPNHEKTSVVITIQDSGVGIAAEHLSKLFTRGFTTKKDGNGIGLHSSIVAIQNMGGSMEVQSDGIGKGAVFTLTFPVQQEVALA